MTINNNQIRMFGEVPGSIVDGPGIRYGVFCQGCSHNCKGCHNPQSHPYDAGTLRDVDEIFNNIKNSSSAHGVTLSGGEPFDQAPAMANLAKKLKEHHYDIWAYSGYQFEFLYEVSLQAQSSNPRLEPIAVGELLANIDVLVDGPFIQSKKSYDALYRGSTNQRLIDVPKSLKSKIAIEWHQNFELPKIPSSW